MTVSLGGERIELRERSPELSALASLLTSVAHERCGRIALVVLEDVHLADEATLH